MSFKKSPYTRTEKHSTASLKVKEWAIAQLKKGNSPNKIAQEIQRLFSVYVALMTVYRWRKKYIEATGENIPSWYELNKTLEQKEKNKSKKRQKRNIPK